MTDLTWHTEQRRLGDLVDWDKNPRRLSKHDAEHINLSLAKFGVADPLIINLDNHLIGGHQRKRIINNPEAVVDVRVPSRLLTPEEAEELAIRLNRNNGEWDWEKLAENFDRDSLLAYGFTSLDLVGMNFGESLPEDPGPQLDKADELRIKFGVELGQLWQLGEHLVLCGDSTDRAAFERLLGGAKAQMVVTSPPYGVGKSYETKGIDAWFKTVRPVIGNLSEFANTVVWQIGDLYATGSQFIEPTLAYSINMFNEHGMRLLWIRIWEKQGVNYGVGPYHLVSNKPAQKYEYIAALGDDAGASDEIEVDDYEWILAFGGRSYKYTRRLNTIERREWGFSGIWQINTVTANDEHPAMFPLELPERCIKMHSDRGDLVIDPFLGSGTTLIGCERLGRKCRAIEISPGYCAVAIQRWVDMVHGTPELIGKVENAR